MSVTLTFTTGMSPLQRVQPLDPSFQIDWSASLVGDATAGRATITASVPGDLAVIPEYMSAEDDTAVNLAANFLVSTGILVGPSGSTQLLVHNAISAVVDTQTFWSWEPPRMVIVPAMSGAVLFQVFVDNPGVGKRLFFHGRCYAWPRSEVINLPQRTFWPYLTH